MSETKINVSQTTITAEDIGAASAFDTMPTASATTVGKIVQYTGNTDSTYTNGFFYKCVSDGQDPATYSWSNVQVQASSGGLPSQTGNSGKFLTTDGTDASWSDIKWQRGVGTNTIAITKNGNVRENTGVGENNTVYGTYMSLNNNANLVAIGQLWRVSGRWTISIGQGFENNGATADNSIIIGMSAKATGSKSVGVGNYAYATGIGSVAVGFAAQAGAANAIQLGTTGNNTTNSDANTFKVANSNGNFEIMSADGTIPTDRFTTTPVADGTYVPTLNISSGVATRSWAAGLPAMPTTAGTYTLQVVVDVNGDPTLSWVTV